MGLNRKFHHAMVLFLMLFLAAGCTKKQESANLSFRFQSKNNSALNFQLQNVIVNISGPNMPVQVFERNCEKESCFEFSVEVDSGSNRLVQLLVIGQEGTGPTKVFYDDEVRDLDGGDNRVELAVQEVASFNREGILMGRYVPSAGSLQSKKLTGDVVMSVNVGAGKPEMRVGKFEIFAGWFRSFLLDGIAFKFQFQGFDENGNFYNAPIFAELHDSEGLDLFSQGLQTSPGSQQVVRYALPQDYYDEDNGVFEQRTFPTVIVGFFGENPFDLRLCSEPLSPSYLFDGGGKDSPICKNVNAAGNCTNHFRWNNFIKAGGVNGVGGLCSSAPNELKIDLEDIADARDDEFVSFWGPFLARADLGFSDAVDFNDVTGVLTWATPSNLFLPGGIEIFLRPNGLGQFQEGQVKDRDGIDCNLLEENGFVSQGVQFGETGSFVVPNSVLTSGDGYLALCPRRPNGEYYSTAMLGPINDNPGPSPNFDPQLDMRVYTNDAPVVVAPGFDFGGSGWSAGNNFRVEWNPTETAMTEDIWVSIRNTEATNIEVLDLHVSWHNSNFIYDYSPASLPTGAPTQCPLSNPATTSWTLTPGQECTFRIAFNPLSPAAYAPGSSIYTDVYVETRVPGAPLFEHRHHRIPMLVSTYLTVDNTASIVPLDFYAPPGKNDVKFVKLRNADGSAWNPSLNGTVGSINGVEIPTPSGDNCGGPLNNMGEFCVYRLEVDNFSGTIADNINNDLPLAGTPELDVSIFSGEIAFNVPPYLFLGVLSADFTIVNIEVETSSAGTFDSANGIEPPSLNPPFMIANDNCGAVTVTNGTPCSFDIDVDHLVNPDIYRQHLGYPYENASSYRAIELELEVEIE
ncbi:MAG: hypothetical protein AAF203_00750 [Pseudomonadota bacterium]